MANLAKTFHSLHKQKEILILPNAWDAGSAKVIEDAGAKAIATSSAGVAWALGYPDGDVLPPRMLADLTARITDVIRIPLSVDFEGGYTNNASKIAENLKPLIDAGAVGINIEDGEGTPELLAKKIEKARKAAESAGVNVFINARTDVYLAEIGNPESRVGETVERAARYRDGGGRLFDAGPAGLPANRAGPQPAAAGQRDRDADPARGGRGRHADGHAPWYAGRKQGLRGRDAATERQSDDVAQYRPAEAVGNPRSQIHRRPLALAR